MRRITRPGFERLEGKALLSGATSGLSASLVATPTTTGSGTTVSLTFTETNVSTHEIQVTYGPISDGFTASQGGKTVWTSNSGIEPQFLVLKTLQPGESLTIHGTWDGHSSGSMGTEGPALHGTFKITDQLNPSASASVAVGVKAHHVVSPRPPGHHKG